MTRKFQPGIYKSRGKLFAYRGKEEGEKYRPYFNVHVYFPDGKTDWVSEGSTLISNAERIDPEEYAKKLAKRESPKNSKLIEWLKENSSN